ncbi:MAG: hypothetical protein QM571_07195 [Micrococcaceae bacterium]
MQFAVEKVTRNKISGIPFLSDKQVFKNIEVLSLIPIQVGKGFKLLSAPEKNKEIIKYLDDPFATKLSNVIDASDEVELRDFKIFKVEHFYDNVYPDNRDYFYFILRSYKKSVPIKLLVRKHNNGTYMVFSNVIVKEPDSLSASWSIDGTDTEEFIAYLAKDVSQGSLVNSS